MISFAEKAKIVKFCKEYAIEYTMDTDGSIDVTDDDVDIWGERLSQIPIKFGRVHYDFNCYSNLLTTLENSPQHVDGDFNAYSNSLSTLMGGPIHVAGDYNVYNNSLTTLEGAPEYIGGDFNICDNVLHSTYSGDTDIVLVGDFMFSMISLPQELVDNIQLVLKYQRHFEIWNEDLTLNDENFQDLIYEINLGLL